MSEKHIRFVTFLAVAQIFGAADPPTTPPTPAFRLWRTAVTVGELKHTVARYLGNERAERSFAEYETSSASPLVQEAEADIGVLRFTEHLLTSAIGAASAPSSPRPRSGPATRRSWIG